MRVHLHNTIVCSDSKWLCFIYQLIGMGYVKLNSLFLKLITILTVICGTPNIAELCYLRNNLVFFCHFSTCVPEYLTVKG